MEAGPLRLLVSAVFYGFQLAIGYILMLIIMIYSGALFLAVVLGLVIGHVLFNAKDAILPINEFQYLDGDDEKKSLDNGSTNSRNGIEASMTQEMDPKSSCCASGRVSESAIEDQRAIREGTTRYGSMGEGASLQNVPNVVAHPKQREQKRKSLDQGIPEGSTPCC